MHANSILKNFVRLFRLPYVLFSKLPYKDLVPFHMLLWLHGQMYDLKQKCLLEFDN